MLGLLISVLQANYGNRFSPSHQLLLTTTSRWCWPLMALTKLTAACFYKQLSCQTLPDYHVQSCQICSNKSRPASRKREAWEKRALTFWAALVPFFCCYSLLFSFHHPLASLLSRTYKQREAEQSRQNENKNTRETKSQWSKKGQGKGI